MGVGKSAISFFLFRNILIQKRLRDETLHIRYGTVFILNIGQLGAPLTHHQRTVTGNRTNLDQCVDLLFLNLTQTHQCSVLFQRHVTKDTGLRLELFHRAAELIDGMSAAQHIGSRSVIIFRSLASFSLSNGHALARRQRLTVDCDVLTAVVDNGTSRINIRAVDHDLALTDAGQGILAPSHAAVRIDGHIATVRVQLHLIGGHIARLILSITAITKAHLTIDGIKS